MRCIFDLSRASMELADAVHHREPDELQRRWTAWRETYMKLLELDVDADASARQAALDALADMMAGVGTAMRFAPLTHRGTDENRARLPLIVADLNGCLEIGRERLVADWRSLLAYESVTLKRSGRVAGAEPPGLRRPGALDA